MPTTEAMFNEFAAALQFPYYFGGNWAAFDECLADLSWLPATGYIITIFDSADLLAKDERSQLNQLFDVLEAMCIEWSKPVVGGQAWDRPSVPFHVLFHYAPEDECRLHERIASIPSTLGIGDLSRLPEGG
jgi:Barstar (barnase inhibitor)